MAVSPDNTNDAVVDEHEPPTKPTRRSGNLLQIFGVGGGAIGGVFIGAANYDAFPIGVILFLVIGAVIGGLLPWIGSFAFLGSIVAFLITALTDNQSESTWVLCPLVGGAIGFLWAMASLGFRPNRQDHASPLEQEVEGTVAADRMQLAGTSLAVGVGLGILAGVLIGGPFIAAGPFIGAVIGGAMFVGLWLSTHGKRK